VVWRDLQRESGGGARRWVSGSSSNDEHLSVIAVIGVRRPHDGERLGARARTDKTRHKSPIYWDGAKSEAVAVGRVLFAYLLSVDGLFLSYVIVSAECAVGRLKIKVHEPQISPTLCLLPSPILHPEPDLYYKYINTNHFRNIQNVLHIQYVYVCICPCKKDMSMYLSQSLKSCKKSKKVSYSLLPLLEVDRSWWQVCLGSCTLF